METQNNSLTITDTTTISIDEKDKSSLVVDKKETKPKKKKQEKQSKVRNWPEEQSQLIPYYNLINPLKDILFKGYKFIRYNNLKNFKYDGFNVGQQELEFSAPVHLRFKEWYINQADQRGIKLIDIVLNTVFQLGIEQGRRLEIEHSNKLMKVVSSQKQKIDAIQNKLFELEGKKTVDWLKAFVNNATANYKIATVIKSGGRKITALAEQYHRLISKEEWKVILEYNSWSEEEWEEYCKNNLLKFEFRNEVKFGKNPLYQSNLKDVPQKDAALKE